MFPLPPKEVLTLASWFPHTCVEPYVRPLFNSPLSVYLTFLPSALFYDLQLPWCSWTLRSGVYLGSPSLGRKLGQQRVCCTSYHLSETQCFAAWYRVSLKLLFHMFCPGFGCFRQETNSSFCYCPLTRSRRP